MSWSRDEHCSCCRDALASAAHELKTPLAIMGGYLHLLLAEKLGPLNPRQMEVLTEMQANGVRLSNFIQNLLTYTALKVDRFDMHYEVGDINSLYSRDRRGLGAALSGPGHRLLLPAQREAGAISLSTTTRCSTWFRICSTMP